MDRIAQRTEELLESIKESEPYLRYSGSLRRLQDRPGVLEKLDRLRRDIFGIYNTPGNGGFLERADRLQRQYEELQKIPEVNEFLENEAELCKRVREINRRLLTEIVTYIPEI